MITAHLAAELMVDGDPLPVFVWTIDHPPAACRWDRTRETLPLFGD